MLNDPGIHEKANPMPNRGKWVTCQDGFLFFANGKIILLSGPRDFPLFTAFFLHQPIFSFSNPGHGEAPADEKWKSIFNPPAAWALQE